MINKYEALHKVNQETTLPRTDFFGKRMDRDPSSHVFKLTLKRHCHETLIVFLNFFEVFDEHQDKNCP